VAGLPFYDNGRRKPSIAFGPPPPPDLLACDGKTSRWLRRMADRRWSRLTLGCGGSAGDAPSAPRGSTDRRRTRTALRATCPAFTSSTPSST